MFSSVDRTGGVEVLDEEDFERRAGDVEPEAMRVADEGWGVEVDGVENVVLRVMKGVSGVVERGLGGRKREEGETHPLVDLEVAKDDSLDCEWEQCASERRLNGQLGEGRTHS